MSCHIHPLLPNLPMCIFRSRCAVFLTRMGETGLTNAYQVRRAAPQTLPPSPWRPKSNVVQKRSVVLLTVAVSPRLTPSQPLLHNISQSVYFTEHFTVPSLQNCEFSVPDALQQLRVDLLQRIQLRRREVVDSATQRVARRQIE